MNQNETSNCTTLHLNSSITFELKALISTPAISIEINCIKMSRITNTILLVIAAFSYGSAFSTTFLGSSRVAHSRSASPASALSMRVVEIDSATAFDNTISSAGDALVIVDYSTTWCGPCKGEFRQSTTFFSWKGRPFIFFMLIQFRHCQWCTILS